tara:strand:+ start:271 stop:549 length:279 start_codon:yes stop_codon:yes gene_type:complete
MSKSELIKLIHGSNDYLPIKDVEDTVNIIIDFLSSSLSDVNRIEIRGFGSFSIRKRNKRIGRNPKTAKAISVPEKYHPYFRSSKSLKESLNN